MVKARPGFKYHKPSLAKKLNGDCFYNLLKRVKKKKVSKDLKGFQKEHQMYSGANNTNACTEYIPYSMA